MWDNRQGSATIRRASVSTALPLIVAQINITPFCSQLDSPIFDRFTESLSARVPIPSVNDYSSKRRQTSKNGKLELRRPKNEEVRPREYLNDTEVERLMKAAGSNGRHRHRDSTMILVTYRHGFRVSELVALRWDLVELDSGRMHVTRIKKGTPSVHPIRGPEMRALRRLKRDYQHTPYVFVTERKGPLTSSAVGKMIARAGENAGFEFPVHPHMLRHATGYKLANDGHDTRAIPQYLGHKNIQHTVRYTELSSTRFLDFWKD